MKVIVYDDEMSLYMYICLPYTGKSVYRIFWLYDRVFFFSSETIPKIWIHLIKWIQILRIVYEWLNWYYTKFHRTDLVTLPLLYVGQSHLSF